MQAEKHPRRPAVRVTRTATPLCAACRASSRTTSASAQSRYIAPIWPCDQDVLNT